MNHQEASPPTYTSLFGDFQLGSNSRSQAYEAVPEFPFTTGPPIFTNNLLPPSNHTPPSSPPINALASFSLKNLKCPQCKCKRFDFTSYFHNTRLFQSPPHQLLDVVERSYVLKNRLQSLLVTYIVNDLREDERVQDIRDDFLEWVRQVAKLAEEVGGGMRRVEGVEVGLEAVKAWSEGMARSLVEHLNQSGGKKMEVQKGWRKEVLSEFRRQWEAVWIAYANNCAHQPEIPSAQGGSYQEHMCRSEEAGQ